MNTSAGFALFRSLVFGMALGIVACAEGGAPRGADDDAVDGEDGDSDADESPGGANGAISPADAGAGAPATDCFAERVVEMRSHLDVCRACHVSGGLAEQTDFVLELSPARDAAYVRQAFKRLGQELVAVPAQDNGRTHEGGALLTKDSPARAAFEAAIDALEHPDRACVGGPSGPSDPGLIGSTHGGHVWSRFCAAQPDSAVLPVDPRTLVKAGANQGKAVHFNAFWSECDGSAPKTCGEYRAMYARGKDVMENGKMWFFGGNHTDAQLAITADDYNRMWFEWGMLERPDDFDARVAERWGIPLGEKRNPYPLPGEDPNATDGGSGQLPVALTQLREEDGTYTGKMSFTCHWCHSGKVGDIDEGAGLGALYGSGNSLLDVTAGFGKFQRGATSFIPLAANKVRGTGDILLYPAIAVLDFDRIERANESIVLSPSQGSVDYPVWWNVGHRARRFHDGSFAMDDSRPVMGFFMPIFRNTSILDIAAGREWIEERDQDVQLWIEALTAPVYPEPIDLTLAKAGAVLFHEKNLWAPQLNNPTLPPEGGNGSCAGCHGAYAPRYVKDPRYLTDPALEGVASYIVPLDVIGTDTARSDSLNERLKETLEYSWWGYGTKEEKGVCFGGSTPTGYLAPPLYGVWASAPYFHNGSVPSVWEVLKPSERKQIWRRVSAPPPASDPKAFMGYDTNLARAYDFDKLGFRYEELPCGNRFLEPELDCTDAGEETNPVVKAILEGGVGSFWFTWNLAPQPLTRADLEKRKIYNTHKYSQDNHGHEFTAVLTDAERRALLEYLKTL